MLEFHHLFVTLCVVAATSYAVYRWRNRRFYQLAKKIPGHEGLPLIGEIHKFANVNFKDYAKKLLSYSDPDRTMSKGWLGPILVLITEDADVIHTLLNSPHALIKPTYFYRAIYMDEGLLVSNGEQNERHRKILNKSFVPHMLQQFIPTFETKSQRCVDELARHVDGAPFDIYDYVGTCTLDVFAYGHLNYDRNFYGSNMIKLIEETRPLVMKRIFSPWFNFKPLYRLSSLHRQMDRYYRILVDILEEVKEINRASPNTTLRDTVINLLMDPSNQFEENELRDELTTFVFAGYETTAISLGSILLMLAMHKSEQQKLRDEIDAIDDIDGESIMRMPYTEMVIKESLRLFGPGGTLGRQTTKEMEIGGYTVPEGSCFVLNMYGMHRNKKYWGEDADRFRPERFEAENFKNIHPHAFAPFSGGKRICIGYKYSMIFMKIFLIQFFRAYTLDTQLKFDELTVEMTPTMVVTQKYMVTIKNRDC